jgi:hypothetical protein
LAVDNHCAEQNVVFKQRDRNLAADTTAISLLSETRTCMVDVLFLDVRNVDYSLPAADSSQWRTWTRSHRAELRRPFDIARRAANRGEVEELAVIGKHVTVSRLAKPDRPFEHCVEHRREIAGRGVDDLQHLGGRGLLSARFCEFGTAGVKLTLEMGYELLGIG